jgi:putative redox protein
MRNHHRRDLPGIFAGAMSSRHQPRGNPMIVAKSREEKFLTEIRDGEHSAMIDAPESHGGAGAGLSPFALLEASLASCLNITLRVYAQTHGIDLGPVETTVSVTRGQGDSTFEYSVKLADSLTPDQTKRLRAALKGCPVHNLFKNPINVVGKD